MPAGRPPIYNNIEELQAKVADYFKNPPRTKKIYNKEGVLVGEVPIITITGLVLHLGFCDRQSFYDYEKRPEFSYTIKKARTFIEQEYEECLKQGNCTGAIFALKNFGWTDRQEIDTTHHTDFNLKSLLSDDTTQPQQEEEKDNVKE